MKKDAYTLIKHHNGEAFARALRDNKLLHIPDIAELVKYTGRVPNQMLMQYLRELHPTTENTSEQSQQTQSNPADPFQLLHQAGYEYVEYADTFEKQNAISKYFRKDEMLCTFRDQTRYQKNYIITAVHKDAAKIKPSLSPKREDEYGTSVITIQIKKTGGLIFITNRYNHSVLDHDNTFNSNPDNIIPGLSAALRSYFHVEWNNNNRSTPLPDGYTVSGQYVTKYNMNIANCCFGDYFYEQHGVIHEIDKNSQIIMDYMILDLKTGQISNPADVLDDFIYNFNTLTHGKKITVSGRFPNQTVLVDGRPTIVLHNSQIKELHMPEIIKAGNNFLLYNKIMDTCDLPNMQTTGNNFLTNNTGMQHINFPKLHEVGTCFMHNSRNLISAELPELERTGVQFMQNAVNLQTLNTPKLTYAGAQFLLNNPRFCRIK